ncbi:MAG: hypothetical protein R3F43_27255 [bacterium]
METQSVYEMPAVYDIAFGYRDVPGRSRSSSRLDQPRPRRPAPCTPWSWPPVLAGTPSSWPAWASRRGRWTARPPCAYARGRQRPPARDVDVRVGDMQAFSLEAPSS